MMTTPHHGESGARAARHGLELWADVAQSASVIDCGPLAFKSHLGRGAEHERARGAGIARVRGSVDVARGLGGLGRPWLG